MYNRLSSLQSVVQSIAQSQKRDIEFGKTAYPAAMFSGTALLAAMIVAGRVASSDDEKITTSQPTEWFPGVAAALGTCKCTCRCRQALLQRKICCRKRIQFPLNSVPSNGAFYGNEVLAAHVQIPIIFSSLPAALLTETFSMVFVNAVAFDKTMTTRPATNDRNWLGLLSAAQLKISALQATHFCQTLLYSCIGRITITMPFCVALVLRYLVLSKCQR